MCTSLTVPSYSNEQLLGRTMDFPTKTPWRLTYLPVNFEWQPVTGTTKYQSKFAVLGGMRHIQDWYLIGDGVNSAGLSVAELYFPVESNYYDAPVEGKINLSPQDFTTWLLTQNGTVKEMEQRRRRQQTRQGRAGTEKQRAHRSMHAAAYCSPGGSSVSFPA